jgi:hypothetical protein
MEIFAIAFFIVILGITGFTLLRNKSWNKIFRALADRHHLTFTGGGLLGNAGVTGKSNGFPLEVYQRTFFQNRMPVQAIGFEIQFPEVTGKLKISAEGFSSQVRKWAGKTDIELQDRRFDEAALVSGDDIHTIRAILHPEAKSIITRLITLAFNGKFSIENGELETYQTRVTLSDVDSLSAEVVNIVRLATLLSREGDSETMLRENFKAETDTKSQTVYFESLATVAEHLAEDDEIVQAAMRSGHPPLEFEAVRAIGPAGDRHIPQSLRSAEPDLALKIIDYLTERKTTQLVPELVQVMEDSREWTVKSALVRFFAASENNAAEGFLQKELDSAASQPGAYRKECIRALGHCGAKGAIEFLFHLKGPLLRRDIEEAIASIQKRLGLPEAGMLSLQDREAGGGGLSLAEDGDGEELRTEGRKRKPKK